MQKFGFRRTGLGLGLGSGVWVWEEGRNLLLEAEMK